MLIKVMVNISRKKILVGKVSVLCGTMSNFGQKNKFCALFLESHWFRFKMCHQCQNQGQTGLEATGGPRGASQPLQSIKIYKNQT